MVSTKADDVYLIKYQGIVLTKCRSNAEHVCSFIQNDELSFDEGDTLYILDMSNSDWWKAKCGSSIGLIPTNYGLFHTCHIYNFFLEPVEALCLLLHIT